MEGISILSGFSEVSGKCLEDVWKALGGSQKGVWRVDGGCFEDVLNKNSHLISYGRKVPMCLEGV